MVHGKMDEAQKQHNMRRFVNHDTNIIVSTTVIEVGVNVPNASVMVIESAERFGLSQLHQLRGRIGRGSHKSFCILLTANKVGENALQKMKIMEQTNDGFVLAEKDLELRGPGEIEGTRQSGVTEFVLADIIADKAMLEAARNAAQLILKEDPDLNMAQNLPIKQYISRNSSKFKWANIS
jgi:ATP-dependent DNA helicase RecG